MKFKVAARHIELISASGLITAGSAGLDTCEFEWSAEWSGFAKTVVFRAGNVTEPKVLVADNEVVQVPPKCLTTPNIPLEVGVYGQLGEKKMPTIWCVAINRVAIGTAPSDTGPAPTPSAYEQWVAQVQAYRDTAMQAASSAANSAADAALDVGQVDAAALIAVNGINAAGVEKVNAVNAAGAAQLNAVNSAGESAGAAIQSAKTEALNAINTQKTNSVSAVMSEGDTQVARVQQAAEYAYSKAESNARFAGALVVKESGNPITVYPDATGAPLTAVSLRGKTTQSGTGDPSPTNIRPISGISASISVNGTVYAPSVPIKLYGQNEVYDTWEPCVMVDGALRSRYTQRWNVVELTGNEDWILSVDSYFTFPQALPPNANAAVGMCSTYRYAYSYSANAVFIRTDGVVYAGALLTATYNKDVAAWKSQLASLKSSGSPVTIVYQLATPIVTLGDPYTIPNAAGNVTISAENTVDVTYNKSLAKAFEQITAAIASLGTV